MNDELCEKCGLVPGELRHRAVATGVTRVTEWVPNLWIEQERHESVNTTFTATVCDRCVRRFKWSRLISGLLITALAIGSLFGVGVWLIDLGAGGWLGRGVENFVDWSLAFFPLLLWWGGMAVVLLLGVIVIIFIAVFSGILHVSDEALIVELDRKRHSK